MGTHKIAGDHLRWYLELGQVKLQAAMGDGTWNGDKYKCRRPLDMELEIRIHQIAGGHGRWNLEWGQIDLRATMGDEAWNGE